MATTASARAPLSRARVFRSAVDLVDADGLAALTMRRLAEALGVEAMSLYHHVPNKEGVLDGIVEVIVGEMLDAVSNLDISRAESDWAAVMRERVLAAREVLRRHPWAPEVIESRRTMIPAVVHYYEGVLAILRRGGFSYDLAHHALQAGEQASGAVLTPDDEEGAARGQQPAQAADSPVPADVEDEIEGADAPRRLGELTCGVVDGVVGTEVADEVELDGACDRGHARLQGFGDLHGVAADAA